jgi:hypothetical protein
MLRFCYGKAAFPGRIFAHNGMVLTGKRKQLERETSELI